MNKNNIMEIKKEKILTMRVALIALVILLVILAFPVALAEDADEEEEIFTKAQADVCMQDSQSTIDQLIADGFSSQRVNDTLEQAQSLYDDAVQKKRKDYVLISDKCEQIAAIKILAFSSRDEFNALQRFYNDSVTDVMDASEVDELLVELEEEITNERYERVEELVDESYEAIIELKSSYTTFEILRRNTANFFVRFFTENWQWKLGTFIVILIVYIFYRKRIWSSFIKRKMRKLEVRKDTLKGLVRSTQKGYFEQGNLSEGIYNIKTQKFAELIRDIDRQLPLLHEELAKLERNKKVGLSSIKYETEHEKAEKKEKPKKEKAKPRHKSWRDLRDAKRRKNKAQK